MLSGGPKFTKEQSKKAITYKILLASLKFPPSFSQELTSLIKGFPKPDPEERLKIRGDAEEVKIKKFFGDTRSICTTWIIVA